MEVDLRHLYCTSVSLYYLSVQGVHVSLGTLDGQAIRQGGVVCKSLTKKASTLF